MLELEVIQSSWGAWEEVAFSSAGGRNVPPLVKARVISDHATEWPPRRATAQRTQVTQLPGASLSHLRRWPRAPALNPVPPGSRSHLHHLPDHDFGRRTDSDTHLMRICLKCTKRSSWHSICKAIIFVINYDDLLTKYTMKFKNHFEEKESLPWK